jgi:hypothetical protein
MSCGAQAWMEGLSIPYRIVVRQRVVDHAFIGAERDFWLGLRGDLGGMPALVARLGGMRGGASDRICDRRRLLGRHDPAEIVVADEHRRFRVRFRTLDDRPALMPNLSQSNERLMQLRRRSIARRR